MTMRYDVTVIGAGFAGSLLARLLALRGRRVLLVAHAAVRKHAPLLGCGSCSTITSSTITAGKELGLEQLPPVNDRD